MHGKDPLAGLALDNIRDDIAHYCGLGERVIDQARRRVLDGERVPNAEKIYSIFEPHTDLIKRGKVRTPVELGHKVFLAESAKGLITQYEMLKGNPADEVHVAYAFPSVTVVRLHIVCRRGGAHQQCHDPCPAADQTLLAPTKSRAIASADHRCKWNKSNRTSSPLRLQLHMAHAYPCGKRREKTWQIQPHSANFKPSSSA
jgi:hypothetical protein